MPEHRGKIGSITLPSLLHAVCSARETGVLTVSDGDRRKRIYVEEGHIVFAGSNDPDERLGALFLREAELVERGGH